MAQQRPLRPKMSESFKSIWKGSASDGGTDNGMRDGPEQRPQEVPSAPAGKKPKRKKRGKIRKKRQRIRGRTTRLRRQGRDAMDTTQDTTENLQLRPHHHEGVYTLGGKHKGNGAGVLARKGREGKRQGERARARAKASTTADANAAPTPAWHHNPYKPGTEPTSTWLRYTPKPYYNFNPKYGYSTESP